jgi:hypothetical protein
MSYHRGTRVIASIASTPNISNVTIVSPSAPTMRDNGGTLRKGDRWYDTLSGVESIWVDSPIGEWKVVITQAKVTTDISPPKRAMAGSLWYRPDTGKLYVYYVDGDSAQWVNVDSY